MPKDTKTFAEIRRLVRESGRTGYDLAKATGLSESTLGRVIRGLNEPSFETAEILLAEIGYQIVIQPMKGKR